LATTGPLLTSTVEAPASTAAFVGVGATAGAGAADVAFLTVGGGALLVLVADELDELLALVEVALV